MASRTLRLAVYTALWIHLFAATRADAQVQDPAQSAKLLSAFTVLREKCESYSFAVAEDTVRDAVLTYLRQMPEKLPKEMPAPVQMQNSLALEFTTQWDELIEQATAGLDPDGELELVKKLTEFVQQKSRVKEETQKKYESFLKNDLPQVMTSVEQKLVESQINECLSHLKDVVASGQPTQETIVAAKDHGSAASAQKMVIAVTDRVPQATRQVLLSGAYENLTTEVTTIIEDGLTQLEEQEAELEKEPEAISKSGMLRELQVNLQKVSHLQQGQRDANPLRQHYDVFQQVDEQRPSVAETFFQVRVDQATERVGQDFVNQRLNLDDDRPTLLKMITDNPREHHDPGDSRRLASPVIAEMTTQKQAWVIQRMLTDLENSKQEDECSQEEFKTDVQQHLATDENAEWKELARVVQRSYESVMLPEIRQEIAQEQALKYAPKLANDQWLPTESDVQQLRDPLTRDETLFLPVWRVRAPARTDVLAETWTLWTSQAAVAVRRCRAAIAGQSAIVQSLAPGIRTDMSNRPENDADYWIQTFEDSVASGWRLQPDARKYPDLFQATHDEIRGIVVQLVEETELAKKERQDRMAEAEEKQETETPLEETAQPRTVENDATVAQEKPEEGVDEPGGMGPGPGGGQPTDGDGGDQPGGTGEGEGDGEGGGEEEEEPVEEEQVPEEEEEEEAWQLGTGGVMLYDLTQMMENVRKPSALDNFYKIAFWILVVIVVCMACGWYFQVRSLKRNLQLLLSRASMTSTTDWRLPNVWAESFATG